MVFVWLVPVLLLGAYGTFRLCVLLKRVCESLNGLISMVMGGEASQEMARKQSFQCAFLLDEIMPDPERNNKGIDIAAIRAAILEVLENDPAYKNATEEGGRLLEEYYAIQELADLFEATEDTAWETEDIKIYDWGSRFPVSYIHLAIESDKTKIFRWVY